MNRKNFINRFYFKNNGVLDDDIGPIAPGKANTFIDQMQFDLPLKSQTSARQFEFETILISMLKKPRTDGTMDLDRHADHPSGHLFPIHLPPTLFVTMVCFTPFVVHRTSPRHEQRQHPSKSPTNP
jgi:hypothetical protein